MNANCHGVKRGSKNLSNMTAPYQCELCDFTTDRKYDLKGHIRCFHNGKLRDNQKASMLAPYQCELCDFTTNRKSDFNGHKSYIHNISTISAIRKLRNTHKASKVVTLRKAAQGGSKGGTR